MVQTVGKNLGLDRGPYLMSYNLQQSSSPGWSSDMSCALSIQAIFQCHPRIWRIGFAASASINMPVFVVLCPRIWRTLWPMNCQKRAHVSIQSTGVALSLWEMDKACHVKWISLTIWWMLGNAWQCLACHVLIFFWFLWSNCEGKLYKRTFC